MLIRILTLLILWLLANSIQACQGSGRAPNATTSHLEVQQAKGTPKITPTLPDPHGHVVDINNNWLGEQNAAGFQIIEVAIEPPLKQDNVATNPDETLVAFSRCSESCGIFVIEPETAQVYELRAPSFLSTRPFSDLVWVTNHILVFDQWTQPHNGVHYAVDILGGKLILASPFPDRVPSLDATE